MKHNLLLCGLVVAILAGTASGQAQAQVPVSGSREAPPPGIIFIPNAPPPRLVEEIPAAPDSRPIWFWQRGYWNWNGIDYVWIPGRWVQRPPEAGDWVPPRWRLHPSGWYMIDGYWR